jgi:iron complex transport system ATP-binding protein
MSAAAGVLLDVQALRLVVGKRTLVDDVSFSVRAGDVWCVLGSNGAGKTLLLHTLAGLRPVDDGAITLIDAPIARWTPDRAARVRAFLPQFTAHAFPMSALDAVTMGRHPHLSRFAWESDADIAYAHGALADVGLESLASRDVTTLSGGERQRVAIATLFAQDARLMLLDEPIAHLDLRHQLRVLERLSALARRGRGIVLSIHDLTLARRCATHALLLDGNGGAHAGPVDDVMRDAALCAAFACRVERVDAKGRTVYVVS